MKFKQTIIKTKISDAIQLQKYLFSLGYFWNEHTYQNYQRNHQLKKFDVGRFKNMKYIYFITGKSCDMKFITKEDMSILKSNSTDISEYRHITYEQLIRKQKLLKIKYEI